MEQAHTKPRIKQLKNEKTLIIYCAILCSFIIFAIFACRSHASRNTPPGLLTYESRNSRWRPLLLVFRKLERRVPRSWFGRPSLGLLVLVGVYLVSNIVLSSTILAIYQVNHLASRFGWMGAANMALCTFLGMKNTPLALVRVASYTHLNVLHRIVGYMTAFLILLHAIFYTVHFVRKGDWETILEANNLAGLGAGIAMLFLLMGIFRHRCYEAFYVSHISGFILAVVLTGLHRPVWSKKLPVVILFIAILWALDRTIRTARILYNIINNNATFYPLPGGGVRLLLKKPCAQAALPGSHCFLWIPRINFYQTHPFTIVNNDSSGVEFVIKSHKGFTKNVYEFATQHSGCATWVSVDGPYGFLPDTTAYDKLILIGGGSGAAFTFGLMNRILEYSEGVKIQSIDFVWAVKRTEHLSWFSKHLHKLTRLGSNMNVTIYITSGDLDPKQINDARARDESEEIRSGVKTMLPSGKDSKHQATLNPSDLHGLLSEAAVTTVEDLGILKYEKMITGTVVCEAIQAVGGHGHILVAACGPNSLINAVRDSADSCKIKPGYKIDVLCEDFSG